MSRRFTPVSDPEKARCEQDEESLRKHRKFDTPFAMLPKDLNEKKQPNNEDMNPMGRPTGEMELDAQGLWRKKMEIFEKPKTWGRETMEYSDPEKAREEGNKGPKWGRKGTVGWGVQGKFGGREGDVGLEVLQRGEVDQAMEKNDKGLWVKKKKAVETTDEKPASEGHWRCPKCSRETKLDMEFCRFETCFGQRPAGLVRDGDKLRSSNPHEDPRLEAAKKKGRGTSNAAEEALKALTARRRLEQEEKEKLGLMRRNADERERRGPRHGGPRHGGGGPGGGSSGATLSSSGAQARPAKRLGGAGRWQGVQRTDDEAKRVVGKALGGNVQDNAAPLRIEEHEKSVLKRKGGRAKDDDDDQSSSGSRSRSRSRSHSPAEKGKAVEGPEVVVDFF